MKTTGERIKELREKRGLTMEQLAERFGFKTYTTISKWESDVNHPKGKEIKILCNLFNVTADYLLGLGDEVIQIPSAQYPYYQDAKISAGATLTVDGITEQQTLNVPDFILKHYAGSKDIFFLHINGESMNKIIQDGSLIAVKKTDINNLKNGDIVVYSFGNEYAVKRFYRTESGILFKPESTDFNFKDHEVSNENLNELMIYGKVIYYGTTI